MKRIIALVLAAVCLFSLAACSASNENSAKKPEIYDMKILSVNGEDITYEFYRYYYLFVKNSYSESGTEVTEEQIKTDVLNKLRYDAAVHKLLAKYSQSLTEDEIKECEEYVGMYVSAYGDVFESQLESEMNMTLNVFTKMTINEMAYNKLFTYLADENNKKLDFSDEAVTEFMKDFKAGMHLILSVNGEKEDAEKKALIEKLYKVAELDSAFAPIMKLHNLRVSLKETEESLAKINDQIANGETGNDLAETLKTLAAQISTLSAKITEEQNKVNVAECLELYMEKLEAYKELVKENIKALINSNDASLFESLDSGAIADVAKTVRENVVSVSDEKITKKFLELAENKTKYGWIPAEFVTIVKSFDQTPTLENAKKITEFYNGNKELKSDTTISPLVEKYMAIVTLLTDDLTASEYLDAIRSLNGSYEISVNLYENSMLYLAIRQADDKAKQLSTHTGDDIYTILEEAFGVLSAPVTTFEELVIAYSDDYEAESGTVVFYLKSDDLIKELQDAVKDLQVGEMTGVVKSSIGYHILKIAEPDIEYFKKNEYVYYLLEDMINAESENVEYAPEEVYASINNSKMTEFEKELSSQKNALAQNSSSSATTDDDNTVLWTIIIIGITIAVVGVLVVLILTASKSEPQRPAPKGSKKSGKK